MIGSQRKDTKEKTMSDIVFAKGINYFPPREQAPDFVLGTISIKPTELVPWLRDNKDKIKENGYIQLQALMSKNGKPYVKLDTYEKKEEEGDPDCPW